MCELMVNDYSRKGFVDGRVMRQQPLVFVRGAIKPPLHSCGIIREPLNGVECLSCLPDLALWLSSPETVINNFIHAVSIPAENLVNHAR